MKKYWTVAALGWQDSLVYRFNALVWVLYAVLPSLTLMLVWIAAYRSGNHASIGGFNLEQMITYYLFVSTLSVVITPNRMLPMDVFPPWLHTVGELLPFASLYSFPMQIFMARSQPHELLLGFFKQIMWIAIFSVAVK